MDSYGILSELVILNSSMIFFFGIFFETFLVGTMIFIFKLSWQLSLICFIGAPIVFAIGELYGKYYKVGSLTYLT
jgi:ATP-binding cassette subfamily B (MDR/TAP) protein 9